MNMGLLYYTSPGIITPVIKLNSLFSIPLLDLNEKSFNTDISWYGLVYLLGTNMEISVTRPLIVSFIPGDR